MTDSTGEQVRTVLVVAGVTLFAAGILLALLGGLIGLGGEDASDPDGSADEPDDRRPTTIRDDGAEHEATQPSDDGSDADAGVSAENTENEEESDRETDESAVGPPDKRDGRGPPEEPPGRRTDRGPPDGPPGRHP